MNFQSIKKYIIIVIATLTFGSLSFAEPTGGYKYGCKANCANGSCSIVGKPGNCKCNPDGFPECTETKSDTVKFIEAEDGSIVANDDDASLQKFFQELEVQTKPKITIEKGK